jgi:hypothetical protein
MQQLKGHKCKGLQICQGQSDKYTGNLPKALQIYKFHVVYACDMFHVTLCRPHVYKRPTKCTLIMQVPISTQDSKGLIFACLQFDMPPTMIHLLHKTLQGSLIIHLHASFHHLKLLED